LSKFRRQLCRQRNYRWRALCTQAHILVAKSAVVMDVMDVLNLGLYFNDKPVDLSPIL
jgi:hypothetical protein